MSIATIKLSKRLSKRRTPVARAQRSGIVAQMPLIRPHFSGADMAVFNGPGMPSSANTTVSFGGDPIMMHAHVALLFYGNAWQSGGFTPSAAKVQAAIKKVLNSPYCSQLSDYACTGGDMDTDWNRIVLSNPPNPFSQGDAEDVVEDVIDSFYSTLNHPPNFYAVILPPGTSLNTPGQNGEHSNDGSTYYSYQRFGPLDFITQVFTHELVEALTDPDGGGWQVDPRDDSNWNEIADICKNHGCRLLFDLGWRLRRAAARSAAAPSAEAAGRRIPDRVRGLRLLQGQPIHLGDRRNGQRQAVADAPRPGGSPRTERRAQVLHAGERQEGGCWRGTLVHEPPLPHHEPRPDQGQQPRCHCRNE